MYMKKIDEKPVIASEAVAQYRFSAENTSIFLSQTLNCCNNLMKLHEWEQ
jgi:hypothetical protein